MPGSSFPHAGPRPVRGLALYPFSAEAPNELSIRPGDSLLAFYRVDSRWLYVRKEGSRLAGYVPFLYCRLLPDRAPDDTSSLSSVASLSDPGLPSPTSSTSSTQMDLSIRRSTPTDLSLRNGTQSDVSQRQGILIDLPPRHGTPSDAWLQASFDSGVSSLRSSGRGELPASATLPPPPRPPRRAATCLRPRHPRAAKKKQVTFSDSEPEVFITPKYVADSAADDIVDLDDLLSRDPDVTGPLPEMSLYETFVSAADPNGDVETVTLV